MQKFTVSKFQFTNNFSANRHRQTRPKNKFNWAYDLKQIIHKVDKSRQIRQNLITEGPTKKPTQTHAIFLKSESTLRQTPYITIDN